MQNVLIYNKLIEIEKLLSLSNDAVMDVEQTAKFLSVSKGSIYNLAYKHRIPYYKPSGKKLYFMKFDLMKWIKNARILTNDEIDELANRWINKRSSWIRT